MRIQIRLYDGQGWRAAGSGLRRAPRVLQAGALSLPDWIDDRWLQSFAAGLAEDQTRYGVTLLGGDTTSTPGPLTLSITALGSIPVGRMMRRKGAKPGDLVFVSGTIGDAGAGLEMLQSTASKLSAEAREKLIRRYRLPEPRLALGRGLIGIASAALDVSDGLIADLGHIAEVSGVHREILAGVPRGAGKTARVIILIRPERWRTRRRRGMVEVRFAQDEARYACLSL